MTPEAIASLIINLVVILIGILLVLRGRVLRKKGTPIGHSASSNDTSISTAFIVCGVLLAVTHLYKLLHVFI